MNFRHLRSALFCDITQRRVVLLYRRFRTTDRSHLQGSRGLDFLTLEDIFLNLLTFRNNLSVPSSRVKRSWLLDPWRHLPKLLDVSEQPIGPIFKGQEVLTSWSLKTSSWTSWRFGTTYRCHLQVSKSQNFLTPEYFVLNVLTLEHGTDRLSRNVSTELQLNAV
jgi:hypothetical protein